MDENLVSQKAKSPILVTLLGIRMLVKLRQPLNEEFSIDRHTGLKREPASLPF